MSTRATVHFIHTQTKDYPSGEPLEVPVIHTEAIVYRHSDGYPDGLGADLSRFIAEVRGLGDSRLNDASYLAAKWVVFDALEHQAMWQSIYANEPDKMPTHYQGRLAFLGVGIVTEDPGDIEYRYFVDCDGRVASIAYESRQGPWDKPEWTHAGVIDTSV